MSELVKVRTGLQDASQAAQRIYTLARTEATKPVGQRPSVWGSQAMVSVESEQMRAKMARLSIALMRGSRHISDYLNIPYNDPTQLGARYAKLQASWEELQRIEKEFDPGIADHFGSVIDEESYDAFGALERNLPIWKSKVFPPVLKALHSISSFYSQNLETANYINQIQPRNESLKAHQSAFVKSQTKKGVRLNYHLSKGVKQHSEMVTTRHDQAWDRRLARDFTGLNCGDYVKWLGEKSDSFWLHKTTVYKVATFLLENNPEMLGSTRTSSGGSPSRKGSASKREFPQNLLKFRKGRLWGLYTFSIEEVSGATTTVARLGRGADNQIADLRLLHTLNSWVREGNKNVQFVTRTGDLGDQETPQSIKYMMRHDYLYAGLKPEDDKHSHADDIDFKSVQSAGGLVAQNGKVISIDNASGHYQPGYKLLEQAVRLVQSNNAFAPRAVVGVVANNEIVYFPVPVFLKLSAAAFEPEIWLAEKQDPQWLGKIPNVMDKTVDFALRYKLFTKKSSDAVVDFASNVKPT